jgi:NADH pyrophosphatase NudC (nudix superfamily)
MKLKALLSRHRFCGRCGESIQQSHRRQVRRFRVLGITVEWTEHRDCKHPHMNPHNPYMRRSK